MEPSAEVTPATENMERAVSRQPRAVSRVSPIAHLSPTAHSPSPPTAVFTVDVEDWYHGVGLTRPSGSADRRLRYGLSRLLDILDESGIRATFFWLGDAALSAPDLLRRTAEAGHEIALHHLHHRFVYQQSPEEFRADVCCARAIIEDFCGKQIAGFRAPYFSITNRSLWALGILAESGFAYDASILPARHYRAGIPGSPPHPYRIRTSGGTLWELPVSAVRRLGMMIPAGGGAYFRLYPQWFHAANFAKFQRTGFLPVFYVHPWELDASHPREKLPLIERLAHYSGLHTAEQRLRNFMENYVFTTAGAYLTTLSEGQKP